MALQDQTQNKRTFYKILQISDDADVDAITASYQRLKSKYGDANDAAARNELLFIEHAYETLSNPNSRRLYDRQVANDFAPPIRYEQSEPASANWFSSSKLIMVMVGVIALGAYGLNTRHTEEVSKISVAKEVMTGQNDIARAGVEGTVENTSKAIDVAAQIAQQHNELAQRQFDIQRQEADMRRIEAENRIKAN